MLATPSPLNVFLSKLFYIIIHQKELCTITVLLRLLNFILGEWGWNPEKERQNLVRACWKLET